MAHPAAAAHCVLLQKAQPRGGLAGVADRRAAVGRRDEAGGEGGDAAQPLEEVEGEPLGGKDRGHRPGDPQQRRIRLDRGAVRGEGLWPQARVDELEAARRHGDPGAGRGLAGHHHGGAGSRGVDARGGGGVAAAHILLQEAAQEGVEPRRVKRRQRPGRGHEAGAEGMGAHGAERQGEIGDVPILRHCSLKRRPNQIFRGDRGTDRNEPRGSPFGSNSPV